MTVVMGINDVENKGGNPHIQLEMKLVGDKDFLIIVSRFGDKYEEEFSCLPCLQARVEKEIFF